MGMTDGRRGAAFREPELRSWRQTAASPPSDLSEAALPFDAAATTAVLNCLTVGVLVLSGDGRMIAHNHALRAICAADDGIRLTPHGLCFEDPEVARLYGAALAARRSRAGASDGNGEPSWIKVGRPSGLWPYVLTLGGFFAPPAIPAQGCLMISVTDPEGIRVVKPQTLSSLFALTPAEARLTVALMRYGSLSAAAPVCGLRPGSARQYMKRVLAKTGTSSQVQLVAQLAAYVT